MNDSLIKNKCSKFEKFEADFVALLMILISLSTLLVYVAPIGADESNPSIWTTDEFGNPQNYFSPGEIVYIHGTGFTIGDTIYITITRPDGSVDVAPGSRFPDSLPVVDENSNFSYEYDLDGIFGIYSIYASDGTNYADTTFTDAPYVVESFSDNTYTTIKDFFDSGETVYGKGLKEGASWYLRLGFYDPNGNLKHECISSVKINIITCDYTLPSNTTTGEWDIRFYVSPLITTPLWQLNDEDHFYVGIEYVNNPILSTTCGIDMVLIIDSSASINSAELTQMKNAFKDFVDVLLPSTPTMMAVVKFDTTATLLQDYVFDKDLIKAAIDSIESGEYTNWEDALVKAHSTFPYRRPGRPTLYILCSDGNPNRWGPTGPDPNNYKQAILEAISQANTIKDDGVRIITIGIGVGTELDDGRLKAISSDDAYYDVPIFENLSNVLFDIISEPCGGNQPPIADAQGPYSGYREITITFNGTQSYDPDGTIIQYLWDFGDENTSPNQIPTHTYTTIGNYTVTLTVTDNLNATDTDTTYILIINDNEPPSKVTGLTVADAKDGKLNLAWNNANDNVEVHHYKIYRNNTFLINRTTLTYQDTGLVNGLTYTYQVSAVDTSGNEGDTSNPVSGAPTPSNSGGGGGGGGEIPPAGPQNNYPIADASAGEPYHGFVNSEITFDGSKSYDSDGNITKWFWVFGDNTNGTGKVVQHTFSKVGTYTITLTVTDNEGTADTDTTFCVIMQPNRPPTTPTITGPTNGTKNTMYTYTAVSTDADNDTLQYTFNWGDGNTTTTSFIPNGTITSQTYQWTNPGKYIITVKAFDNQTESETNESIILIDVLPIDDVIKGYLIDVNSDGTYELFNNTETGVITNVSKGPDGSYLIDSNGDKTWDYIIDKNKKILKYPSEEETDKYTTNIIIISAGGIALLGICYFGLTETGKYKIFAFFLSLGPLFTRIQRNEALNQEMRENIYEYIESNPGAYYNSIMKNLGIGNGSLSHHLNMLEKMDMVKSRREGIRYRAFYLSELQFPETEKYRFTELQEKIVEKIKENEGITQTQLTLELGLTQQTINYNIKKLERNNIIRLERKGGKTYCYYLYDVKKEK
jgi:PKD repeat protein/DNA-binding transcriptional ArsR family regulator